MEMNIMKIGLKNKKKEKVKYNIKMEMSIQVIGLMIKEKVKEKLIILIMII